MENNINLAPEQGQGSVSPEQGQGTQPPEQGQGDWLNSNNDNLFDFEGQGLIEQDAPEQGQGEETIETDPIQPSEQTTNWADKFNSPEEMYAHYQKLEKSYNNLRPKLTKTAMELSALRKQPPQPQQQYQPPQTQPQQQYQPPQYYQDPHTGQIYPQQPQLNPYEEIDRYVQQAVQPIREQQEDLKMQNEIAKLAASAPDFDALAPEIVKVFQSTPQLWNIPNPLEVAYHIARSRTGTQELSKAVSNARQEAYKNREIKELNGSERTKNATQAQKSDAEQLADDILSGSSRGSSLFR
jgi:hypothetical protein